MNNMIKNYIIDAIIFVLIISLAANGLLLQIIYHMKHNPAEYVYLFLNKNGWLMLHKVISILITLGILIHLAMHINWIKNIVKIGNKNKSLVLLLITFVITALIGFISWFFNNNIIGYNYELRNIMMEIHDKITLILIVLLIIHFIKKSIWLIKTYSYKNNRNEI